MNVACDDYAGYGVSPSEEYNSNQNLRAEHSAFLIFNFFTGEQ